MKTITSFLLLAILGLLAFTGAATAADGSSASPTRIVVIPFYTETGRDVRDPATSVQKDYRRIQRFINNQLVRHGFEAINSFAHEWTQAQHDTLAQRARSDSMLAAKNLSERYSTDIVYLLWLKVKYMTNTPENLCKV